MSHGAVKSDSLMEQGVVGRNQARRGQPAAKTVTQSVAQPVWRAAPGIARGIARRIARCWH